jgi:hypothetical protein
MLAALWGCRRRPSQSFLPPEHANHHRRPDVLGKGWKWIKGLRMGSRWGRALHTMFAARAASFQCRISRRPTPMRHPLPALVVPNSRSHRCRCKKGRRSCAAKAATDCSCTPQIRRGGRPVATASPGKGGGPAEAERRGGRGEGGISTRVGESEGRKLLL